jgi:hypothetical protein
VGAATCVLFLIAHALELLFDARALQGVAVGLTSGSASAALLDLRPRGRPTPVVPNAALTGGQARGANRRERVGAVRVSAHPLTSASLPSRSMPSTFQSVCAPSGTTRAPGTPTDPSRSRRAGRSWSICAFARSSACIRSRGA